MPPLMQLPAYEIKNALVNFEPLNNGLDSIRTAQVQNKKLEQADDLYGLQRDHLSMQQAKHAADMQDREILRMGKEAEAIHNMQGPARQSAWTQWTQRNPKVAEHMAKVGIDPNDFANGPQFIATEAAGYDPQKKGAVQADIAMKRAHAGMFDAQAKALGQKDALDGWINNLMQGGGQQSAPAQGGNPNVRKQSMDDAAPAGNALLQPVADTGAQDPNLIQVQAADGAAPKPDLVETPIGMMPRDKAKALSFALAMKGKGEASKMFNTDKDLNIDKGARAETEKAMINNIHHVARLQEVASQFKDEYLQVPYRIGQKANAIGEVLGIKLDPEKQKKLAEYTAFRANSARNTNLVLKELSGSAVTENEYDRNKLQEPNAGDGGWIDFPDSPTAYKSKLLAAVQAGQLAIARQNFLRKQNITPEAIQAMVKDRSIEKSYPLEGMKKIYDNRSDEITRELKAQMPQAGQDQINNFRRQKLKQEFGI